MKHADKAKRFLQDKTFASWQDEALWFVRQKRDLAIRDVPEWEVLTKIAENIKAHTLSHLDTYLMDFEKNAQSNGFVIHWAEDAQVCNEIIYNILKNCDAKRVVKSKSMLTEECHLNSFLESKGINVTDTDLGERIIQLRKERPSHIVLPAIHLRKEQVAKTFQTHLNSQKGNSDPVYLTQVARQDLREKFFSADAAITGVNFAVSETGSFVVCTNEGNADIAVAMTNLHIAVMGIEKVIPKSKDLAIFTRLLARSATGQSITTYTSHFTKPKKDSEVHIIIVDNGRSNILKDKRYKSTLQCIRCGACMNSCPIYRRSGGHSYSYIIPGPIGSLLGANRSLEKHGDLVFASTLCGSCNQVCPVKIDISNQLLAYRSSYVQHSMKRDGKYFLFKFVTKIMQHRKSMDMMIWLIKKMVQLLPRRILYSRLNIWGAKRELPTFAPKTFSQIYKEEISDE